MATAAHSSPALSTTTPVERLERAADTIIALRIALGEDIDDDEPEDVAQSETGQWRAGDVPRQRRHATGH